MPKKIFISYSHAQADWVFSRLEPCLRYGGADTLVDRTCFRAGKALLGQIDDLQDTADRTVAVLSEEYLNSQNFTHELKRAIERDSDFTMGSLIIVKRSECQLPPVIATRNPLYVDLRDDLNAAAWNRLLQACDVGLGAAATDWLGARDEILALMDRGQSVNLLVQGEPRWTNLIQHLRSDYIHDMGIVNLADGATTSRPALIEEILKGCGVPTRIRPNARDDLVILSRQLSSRASPARLALLRFDDVRRRRYGEDFYSALKTLVMDSRKLIVLIQSRVPLNAILPESFSVSPLDIQVVELRGAND